MWYIVITYRCWNCSIYYNASAYLLKYLKAMSRFKSKNKPNFKTLWSVPFCNYPMLEWKACCRYLRLNGIASSGDRVSQHSFFWCLLWCCNHGFLFKTTIKLELFKVKFFSSKTSKIFLIKWWFFKYCPVLHFSHLPTARQLFRYWRATQWISLLTVTSCHRIQIPCIIKNAISISETFSIWTKKRRSARPPSGHKSDSHATSVKHLPQKATKLDEKWDEKDPKEWKNFIKMWKNIALIFYLAVSNWDFIILLHENSLYFRLK